MIVQSSDPVLAGFLRDLDAASPLPVPTTPADLSAATAADIEAARVTWANRVIDEYRGFIVFSEVLALLGDAAAPFAVLSAVERVIADELRHVRLCHMVVEWLGGWDDLHPDLEGMRPRRTAEPPLAAARRLIALEMVVGESESLPMFDAFRRATTDASIQRVLAIILHDEVRHAAAGRAILPVVEQSAVEAGVALDPDLAEAMATTRERIRALYRRAATDGPGRALGASIRADDLALTAR